jgi:3'-5' exonuclease
VSLIKHCLEFREGIVPTIIAWDLETVPDLDRYAAANGLIGHSEEQVRADLGDKFPKHIYHSIVCIGAVVAHQSGDSWSVDAIGAPHVGDRTEQDLIAAFVEKIAELRPRLVTFNGNSFDLPVLRYRAMVHSIAAPGLTCRPYFHRYTSDCLDLCDELSSFNFGAKVKLDELSKALGCSGKPIAMDGSEVESYFRARRIREIADYCESDVVNTYRIWLRYELFCGRLSKSGYEASENSLRDFIEARSSAKPHIAT